MKDIIKKYPKARLESCRGGKMKVSKYNHNNGCYLKLNDENVNHSMAYEGMIVLDFNKKNELISIEFVDGLPYKKTKSPEEKNK